MSKAPFNPGVEYVCAYVISFKDGGPDEGRVVQRGAYEQCDQIRTLIPAVSYSGGRPIAHAEMVVIPRDAWEAELAKEPVR